MVDQNVYLAQVVQIMFVKVMVNVLDQVIFIIRIVQNVNAMYHGKQIPKTVRVSVIYAMVMGIALVVVLLVVEEVVLVVVAIVIVIVLPVLLVVVVVVDVNVILDLVLLIVQHVQMVDIRQNVYYVLEVN